MATRNAQNARSVKQRAGEASGATRKGASQAKPSKGAATTVRKASSKTNKKTAPLMTKEEKRAAKRTEQEERNRVLVVNDILLRQDPAYRFRRKIWWVLMGVGVLLTITAWVCMLTSERYALSTSRPTGMALVVVLILAYASILGAFVYDLIRIRPLRKNIELVVASTPQKRLEMIIDEATASQAEAKEAHKELKKAKKNMTKEEKQALKEEKRKAKLVRKMYGKEAAATTSNTIGVDEHVQKISELTADGFAKAEAHKKARQKQHAKKKAEAKTVADKKKDKKKK